MYICLHSHIDMVILQEYFHLFQHYIVQILQSYYLRLEEIMGMV